MKPIDSKMEWTPALLEEVWREIEIVSHDELELSHARGNLYPNQFEIVSAEQMLDAYSSTGMPVHYYHWSFGKDFLENQKKYEAGDMGLAFELVINSSPTSNLLMEENPAYVQAMVMAHAGVGHNAVFANNVYFREWTLAGSIVDYMTFARDYIRMCEERYGAAEVEAVLDAAHALAPHGIDKYKRKHRPKLTEEAHLRSLMAKDDARQRELDIILQRTTVQEPEAERIEGLDAEAEENLVYFIMKRAPKLEQWKREILRITYKINTYFSSQGVTKILNEGYATFCHFYIMERLEEKGLLTADAYMAFLTSHAAVVYQPTYNSRHYSGPNPYALGFAIFRDIKRICEGGEWVRETGGQRFIPITDEDRQWFPQLIGRRWQDVTKEAAFEYRDDSFIQQFLSPKVIRDLRLFVVSTEEGTEDLGYTYGVVTDIHDEEGYRNIRSALARSVERVNYVPKISVHGVGIGDAGEHALHLKYEPYEGRGLDDSAKDVLAYIDTLWGYEVVLT